MATDERYLVHGLMRGIDVLRCFNHDEKSLTLGEVSKKLGWSRSEPFRFLYTLQHLGYLKRDEESKRYTLTPKVIELGFAAVSGLELADLAQPYLEHLRDLTGASAHVGQLEGSDVVYVAQALSRSRSKSKIKVGSRLPAHATSMGKTLIAAHDDAWILEWLERTDLERFTRNTIAEKKSFLGEIENVRRNGFGSSDQEFEAGFRSVAAPIRNGRGEIIAAINVSAPAATLSGSQVSHIVLPAVREAAIDISHAYGWRADLLAESAPL